MSTFSIKAQINDQIKFDSSIIVKDVLLPNEFNYIDNSRFTQKKNYINKPFFNTLFLIEESLIYFENNGYPFSNFKCENFKIENDSLCFEIILDKSSYHKIDSIIIKSEVKIPYNYLYKTIGIKKNSIYSQKKINQINDRINDIPFLQLSSNPKIGFGEKATKLVLFIEKKRSNVINAMLGMIPGNTNSSLKLAGELEFKIYNVLNTGEKIEVNWNNLGENIQIMDFDFNTYYLLSTPIGLDFSYNMEKIDSSYFNSKNKIGFSFSVEKNRFFSFYLENNKSILLNNYLASNLIRPYNYRYLSIGFRSQKLDNIWITRKGYIIDVRLKQEISKDDMANSEIILDFSSRKFFPVGKNFSFHLATNFYYSSRKSFFENNLVRIGGAKSIRGFNERELLASSYYYNTFEYHYIFGNNSSIFALTDLAFIKNKIINNSLNVVNGIGLGMQFGTKNSIFKISTAIGKTQLEPFLSRGTMIHLSYLSIF